VVFAPQKRTLADFAQTPAALNLETKAHFACNTRTPRAWKPGGLEALGLAGQTQKPEGLNPEPQTGRPNPKAYLISKSICLYLSISISISDIDVDIDR